MPKLGKFTVSPFFLCVLWLVQIASGASSDLATEQYVDNKVAKEAVRANSRIDAAIAEIATKTVVTTNTVPGEIEPMEEVVTNVYSIIYTDTETNYYTKGETEQKIQELAPSPGDYSTVSNAALWASNGVVGIKKLIPREAREDNQLADKEWVDKQVEASAAYYITADAQGRAFASYVALTNATEYYSGGIIKSPTRNDYAVVLDDETHGGGVYRYIYEVPEGHDTGYWNAQYPIETNDYGALSDKPQINGHTLTNNQTGASLGLQDALSPQQLDYIDAVPSKVSENDFATATNSLNAALTSKLNRMEPISWFDLKAKKDGGTLVPGQEYRITNYVATTNGDMDSRSANHPFDVIVVADATNVLNEAARAIQHTASTNDYFYGCNLAAWKIQYRLDNDTMRFAWAVADGQTDAVTGTSGRGVVYRMVDEFNNDVPYDFKGIRFFSYGDIDSVRRYTFDSGSASGNTDYSLNGIKTEVHDNKIAPLIIDSKHKINAIAFKGGNCFCNTFGSSCFRNTFGFGSSYNTFGNCCYDNTFGTVCRHNTIGDFCYNNTIGDFCSHNIFNSSCSHIALGSDCASNTFGSDCSNNTIGDRSSFNTFGNDCDYLYFGDGATPRSFYSHITVESGVQYVNLNCTNATDGAYYQYVTLKSGIVGTETHPKQIVDRAGREVHTTFIKANSREVSVP